MYIRKFTVAVTTDSGGDATAYTAADSTGNSAQINGEVISLQYVKTDFADGVDFTITDETAGQTIWTELNVNAAKTVAPQQATHSTAGVASLYAAAGEPVETPIVVANERIKIVVASGGDTKSGSFIIKVRS